MTAKLLRTAISPELLDGWDVSAGLLRDAMAGHLRVIEEVRAVMGDAAEGVSDGRVVFRRNEAGTVERVTGDG